MDFRKIGGPNPVLTGLRFVAIPQPQVETWGYYKFVSSTVDGKIFMAMPPSINILGIWDTIWVARKSCQHFERSQESCQ